jgi:hypothetical protein
MKRRILFSRSITLESQLLELQFSEVTHDGDCYVCYARIFPLKKKFSKAYGEDSLQAFLNAVDMMSFDLLRLNPKPLWLGELDAALMLARTTKYSYLGREFFMSCQDCVDKLASSAIIAKTK